MAKSGYKIIDSDMHIMEPPDLWERYIDPQFRSQAPRGRTSENVRDLGTIFPKVPVDTRRTGGTPHRGRNFDKNQDIYRNHAERGWTGGRRSCWHNWPSTADGCMLGVRRLGHQVGQ